MLFFKGKKGEKSVFFLWKNFLKGVEKSLVGVELPPFTGRAKKKTSREKSRLERLNF